MQSPDHPLQGTRQLIWQHPVVFAALIGVAGALLTIGFREAIHAVETLAYGRGDSLVSIARSLQGWQRVLPPVIGGVVAGLLLRWTQRWAREEHGGDYMEAIALGSGELGVRHSLLKALSSLATVASGGAIGREGPMVQLAALAGSLFGRWWQLPVPRRRLYVACGAAAGIATAYNTPIAAALFIAEIVLNSLSMASLAPLIVSAFTANLVVRQLAGYAPTYHMPFSALSHDVEIMALLPLGLLAGALAPLYLAVLDQAHALFRRWHAPLWLKLGTGGLIVGLISLLSPEVWGNGYSVVNAILQDHWSMAALLAVLFWKVLAVSATSGSGAVGGIFTPTLFVGAVLGALFGALLQQLWPGLVPVPVAVVIGMGAFLAACTHAPLMSILMLFEMTQNYNLMVPLMATCVLGYLVSHALRVRSIYAVAQEQLKPAPALTIAADLLHADPPTVAPGQSMQVVEERFRQSRWQHVYVTDAAGRFLGAIPLQDFRLQLLPDGTAAEQAWPPQLLRANYPRVRLEAPAWEVLEVFSRHPGERLPVLDTQDRLIGYVVKSDLVLLCRDYLAQL